MKAQELRIGNYYLDNENNISSISGYELWQFSVKENQNCYEKIKKEYKPIPLTEEWLLKFGGIKHISRSFPSYNLNGLQFNYINKIWHEYVRQIDIKSVHQLQNLYFALTGNELELIENLN